MPEETRLDYSLVCTPSPLTTHGSADLHIVVSNGGQDPVDVTRIMVGVRVGDTSQALTPALGAAVPSASSQNWSLDTITPETVLATPGYQYATFKGARTGGEGLTLSLTGVRVNGQPGTTRLEVLEWSGAETEPRRVLLSVPKVGGDAAQRPHQRLDFRAEKPRVTTSEKVRLVWNGDPRCAYSLAGLPGESTPRSVVAAGTPDPSYQWLVGTLSDDAVFTLIEEFSDASGTSVKSYATCGVSVSRPVVDAAEVRADLARAGQVQADQVRADRVLVGGEHPVEVTALNGNQGRGVRIGENFRVWEDGSLSTGAIVRGEKTTTETTQIRFNGRITTASGLTVLAPENIGYDPDASGFDPGLARFSLDGDGHVTTGDLTVKGNVSLFGEWESIYRVDIKEDFPQNPTTLTKEYSAKTDGFIYSHIMCLGSASCVGYISSWKGGNGQKNPDLAFYSNESDKQPFKSSPLIPVRRGQTVTLAFDISRTSSTEAHFLGEFSWLPLGGRT
ncbi:hypothetical protein [Nocardiopsis aegyptia]|uniref:Uncharacterized protein n=1 Tax=Nocardiopsis aegyptia TaxID=220378 RepID=A0A7Z0ELX4_9ACTN|nr:hypothetical protein [Nocardiopsis aegyptia]NYJ34522.1 hypothetical protein [Nocardiopsis aegyptia]